MSESIRAIPINLLIWWTGISRRPRIGVREPWNTAKLQTNWFRAFLFYIYKSAWNPPFWSGAICLPVSKIIQFGNWEYRFVMVCLVFVFWKTCFVIKFSEALPYYRECILSRLQETIPRYRTLKPETTSFPKFTVMKPVWPFIRFWDRWGSKSITVWEWRFFSILCARGRPAQEKPRT